MRKLVAVGAVLTVLGAIGTDAEAAAGLTLYLVADSVPSASMSPTSPGGGPLPNFDPDRDSDSGLLLKKGDGSAGENDPTKYQQWSRPVGGETLSIEKLEIWAAAKDFNRDKTVIFNVFVLDCGGSCQVLDAATATLSGGGRFQQTTVTFDVSNHLFAPGHELSVKLVVDNDSDDDMWFAYATAAQPAHLSMSSSPATTTTTSTTSTSVVAAPSPTTIPPVSPTTGPVGPGGSPGTTSSTTSTTTSSTTSTTLAQGSGGVAGTTTTTTPTPGGGGLESAWDPADRRSQADGPGSGNDTPTLLVPVAVSPPVEDAGQVTRVLDQPRPLHPEEGLTVAFSTAVEAIRLHWRAALALGTLAAILLVIGGRRDHESLVTTALVPHHLLGGWVSHTDE